MMLFFHISETSVESYGIRCIAMILKFQGICTNIYCTALFVKTRRNVSINK